MSQKTAAWSPAPVTQTDADARLALALEAVQLGERERRVGAVHGGDVDDADGLGAAEGVLRHRLAQRQPGQPAGGIADVLRAHARVLDHGREQVADRRLALVDDVAAGRDEVAAAAGEQRRELVVRVDVAVGEAAAVDRSAS